MVKSAYFGKDSITPDFLRHVEENAKKTKPVEDDQKESATDAAKNSEKDFKFTGSGKSLADAVRAARKKKPKLHSIKKATPVFLITSFIFVAIFFMFSMVSNLGNQIETLITRATDTMFGSYSENTIRITEELLAGKRGEFPEYFKDRLQEQGITVAGGEGGYTLDWSGIKIGSSTFREVYSNDVNFREAYTKAKRGRTSNFYDMSANFAFTRLGISRNLYRSYDQTGDSEADNAAYKKTESDLFEDATSGSLNTVIEQQKTDENGNPMTDDDGNPIMERIKSGEDIGSSQGGDSRVKAKGYLTDIAGRVADTTSLACAALKVANMVSVTVAAAEIYEAINYFLSNAENISKTKAGDGNNAAQSYLLNFLNESTTTTYTDFKTGEEKEISGAPIEAEGFANVLAGTNPDTSKTSNYSVESAFVASGFAIGLSAVNNKVCGGLRAVGATVSLAVGLLGGGIVKSIATLAKTTFINFAMQQGIVAILGVLIPKIAQSLFENSAESLASIPAGETFVKGAALGNKKVARGTSGQMLASKEVAAAYSKQTKIANAYESELGRKNRSPFDTSSPDTFLGRIVSKLAVISGSSTLFSSLSNISSVVGNTFASLVGTTATKTFANSITDPDYTVDYELAGTDYSEVFADESDCEYLTDIGAACGMYGEEITATDPNVMKVSSDDPKYLAVLEENVRKLDDGTYEVIPNSLLANKIMYCDERDSPFGVYDSNIASAFETSLGFMDNIPVLNDVVDLVNAVEDMDPETEGWARGTFCVMNPATNYHYEDLIYLQHFTEDQRIAVQIELDEVRKEDGSVKSPTLAYKEAWYAKNPIDTTEAGLLARYTGTTKKEAEEFLALLEYYEYLSNYTPPAEEKEEYKLSLESSNFENILGYILHETEFINLRNRSFAA